MTRSTDPTRSFPPPTDSAARYDAVVRRGQSLRRRQRLARGAGAGGVALVVLLVAVLVIGRSGGSDNKNQVVANPTSSTTSTAPLQKMTVKVDATPSSVDVTVDDPKMPQDPAAKQCVKVRLTPEGRPGTATAEAFVCWLPRDGAGVTRTGLVAGQHAEVGCSATVERPDPSSPTVPDTSGAPQHERHGFQFTVPTGLPPGSYVVEAEAVSGIGDGCTPQQTGEFENAASGKDGVTLP